MWNLAGSPFDLTGRVAIVTGGARGLGAVMGMGLAQAGANVAVIGRRIEACTAVTGQIRDAGGQAFPAAADITNPDSVNAAFEQVVQALGPVDILVNNAGISPFNAPLDQTRLSGWHKVLETNLTGALICTQAVVGGMQERRQGKIINVASAAGAVSTPGIGVYGVSKAGLIHLTRQLAAEQGPYNIQVNAIAPGYMDVGVSEAIQNQQAFFAEIVKRTPMRRIGKANELIGALILLASDASSYITGQTLFIDGGLLA
jgi:2-deoxy-D-gluconate 3-dehydrogenase